MGNHLATWLTREPSPSLPFDFATPETACIVASPQNLPGLSKLPTWIFRSNFNRPGFPIAFGSYVVVHIEAVSFCHPDEPTPLAQGHVGAVVYLNSHWLAFRLDDPGLGATHWLAMPQRMVTLDRWQRLRGWCAGKFTPGTPVPLSFFPPPTDATMITFPIPAFSALSLPVSQSGRSPEEEQRGVTSHQD